MLRTWADAHTLEMLRPSRAKGSRLEHYGILGRIPCLAANLCLNQATARLVHLNLAKLINMSPVDCYDSKLVRSCKLRMHRAPPWTMDNRNIRQAVSQYQTRLRNQIMNDPVHQLRGPCYAAIPISFKIQCPHCDCAKQVRHISLICKTTWKQLNCVNCCRSIMAAKWKCVCQNIWHKCRLPRQLGFACRSATPSA